VTLLALVGCTVPEIASFTATQWKRFSKSWTRTISGGGRAGGIRHSEAQRGVRI